MRRQVDPIRSTGTVGKGTSERATYIELNLKDARTVDTRNRYVFSYQLFGLFYVKGGDDMAYTLTEAELKQLKKLQDKQRNLAKKEAAFWKQVDERRAEILQHFDELDMKKNAAENAFSHAVNSLD